jgi:hypothetical protein
MGPRFPLSRSRCWQLLNAWRARPVTHTVKLAIWLSLAIGAPASIRAASPDAATAVLQFVVSLDIPLVLAFAGVVIAVLLPKMAEVLRRDPDQWALPPRYRGVETTLNVLLALTTASTWPLAVLLASVILGFANPAARSSLNETLSLMAVGILIGALGARIFHSTPHSAQDKPAWHRVGRGFTHLSWAPFRKTLDEFNPRRLALLIIPVLLAAPMGVAAADVIVAAVVWVGAMYCLMLIRSAINVMTQTRRWISPFQLTSAPLRRYTLQYTVAFLVCVGLAITALDAMRAFR